MINKFLNRFLDNINEALNNNKEYPLHEPFLFGNEIKYLNECVKDNFVSSAGKFLNKLEDKIKKYTNSKYCILLNSGTSALHLGLVSIGIKNNDEVLLPALNFIASSNAILYCGGHPHYIDSDQNDLGINIYKLERYLNEIVIFKDGFSYNKRTKNKIIALIAMHTYGHIGKISKLKQICKNYNIILIEDSAEALGSFYNNKHAGTFGKIGIFSFNSNKIITTGNGGAVITNDQKIASRIKFLSETGKKIHQYEFIHTELAYNYRMSNINAALGLAQFENIKVILNHKKKLNKKYSNIFDQTDYGYIFKEVSPCSYNNWFQILMLNDSYKKEKNNIIKFLISKKIYTRPLWKSMIHAKHLNKYQYMDLNNTNDLYNKIICLPSSRSAYGKSN